MSFYLFPNFTDLLTVVQVPKMNSNTGLIDIDTPQSAWTMNSFYDSSQKLQLVFYDEFETPNRTFCPGDDP